MSPRQDSPLVKAKPFNIVRKVYSGPKSSEKGIRGLSKTTPLSSFDSTLGYSDSDLYAPNNPEILRDSIASRSGPDSTLAKLGKDPQPKSPCVPYLSELLGEVAHAPSDAQGDTSMRGRQTRPSTDSAEQGMPSGSGSSRLTSPMGRREKSDEGGSPETPKSGKRKRQKSQDDSSKNKSKAAKASVVLADSDAEIIEVDDTDTPPAKPIRALRSATVLTDHSKVCEFPVNTKDSVSVCLADYKTLEHDTFLNDIIIDFYLTYLYHKFLNKEDRPTVHIFSTMFYKRLNSTPKKATTVASYEKDSSLKPAEKRHMRVKGWTKNVNLFEKNMVIIPICEHSHWYLVIAIRPGLITIPVGSEDRQTKGEPFIIVLDSMGGNKTAAVTNIRHYLAAEWKAKMCGEELDEDEYEFSSKEMRTVRPKKPEQENYSDCGVYLLHYIEKMFNSVAQYYWPASIQDLTNWFTTEEISTKRSEIANLIRQLSEDQNPEKEMKFPTDIPFLPSAPSTRSKKRHKDFEHMSDSDSDDWGKGYVLGGSSSGIAAAGFYGERSGPTRSLRSGDTSSSTGGSGESDVSSYTASEIAREVRHRNREQRSKEKTDSRGSKLVKDKPRDIDASRKALSTKIKNNSDFDEMKEYESPKAKPSPSESDTAEEALKKRTGRKLASESVIVVDPSTKSSQDKYFKTSVFPVKKSPGKVRQLPGPASVKNPIPLADVASNSVMERSSGVGRNSMQMKSRADLHKEMNCVADLHKIEAEMEEEEEEDNVEVEKLLRKKHKQSSAMRAFRADQKAIHESIVNEASASKTVNIKSKIQTSKSLPILSKKKIKSTPEKSKVLQNKVLEDLLELEEEGNTDEEEDAAITENFKVLEIQEKPELVAEAKKVKVPKVKEAFRSIVTEKVLIKDGKEVKVAPELEAGKFIESLNRNELATEIKVEPLDIPITFNNDVVTPVVKIEPLDAHFPTFNHNEVPTEVKVEPLDVNNANFKPMVPTLEVKVEPREDSAQGFNHRILTPEVKVEPLDVPIEIVNNIEPTAEIKVEPFYEQMESIEYIESPPNSPDLEVTTVDDTPEITTVDDGSEVTTIEDPQSDDIVAITDDDDFPLVGFLEKVPTPVPSESDVDSVVSVRQEPIVKTAKSTSEQVVEAFTRNSTSEPESPKVKSILLCETEPVILKSLKSTSEPESPQHRRVSPEQDLESGSTLEYTAHETKKSTSEPDCIQSEDPEPLSSKSTSEPRSPIIGCKNRIGKLKNKSTSESVVLKKPKPKSAPKIFIDSDSDDGGNSSGSDINFRPSKVEAPEIDRVSRRPRRERQFSSLSEIERAKLKNIPTEERKRILANWQQKQKKKPEDRNQPSKEGPFYLSPRGAKAVQQQRGGKIGSRSSRSISDDSANDGSFHAGSITQESIQIDYSSPKKSGCKKRFTLNTQGKCSSSSGNSVGSASRYEARRYKLKTGSESGSEYNPDLYTTEDL